jgi:hypothetical protein
MDATIDNDSHVKLVLPANYVIAASSSAISFPVIEETAEPPQIPQIEVTNEPPPYEGGEVEQTTKERISYIKVIRLIELGLLVLLMVFHISMYIFDIRHIEAELYRLLNVFLLFIYILCIVIRIRMGKSAKSPNRQN